MHCTPDCVRRQIQDISTWLQAVDSTAATATLPPDCGRPVECAAGKRPRDGRDSEFPTDACQSCKVAWLSSAVLAACSQESAECPARVLDQFAERMFLLRETELAYMLTSLRFVIESEFSSIC